MPGIIRTNSAEVSQRRPMLGFTVRTGGHPFFEVAVATAPDLFRPEARGRRTPSTFWSSRAGGPLAAERGEAVYLVPAEVLSRFAGQPRLYFALATFADAGRGNPSVQLPAPEVAPYVTITPDFSGRPARALAGAGTGSRWSGSGYGVGEPAAAGASLEWAGDAARPGVEASIPAPAHNGAANGNGAGYHGNGSNGSNGNAVSNGSGAAPAASAGLAYDDGFDPELWSRPFEAAEVATEEELDAGGGIEGPIPDEEELGMGQSWAGAMTAPTPEYPGASRFAPAHSGNFRSRQGRPARTIRRIVIHITDGNRRIEGPISWFQNPRARVSAHYIVGQDGEVVQMVRHNDVAWHAGSANGDSIGIEHVASRRRNILPTVPEYCASARLVRWLCQQYGLPLDRQHIVGHSEADTRTTHTGCPASAWDWDYFMSLVAIDDPEPCRVAPHAGAQSLGVGARIPVGRIAPAGTLAQVAPGYAPSDPQQALAFMQDWGRRVREWKAGVSNTRIFPHTAICQLRVSMPGGSGIGTGFYIGPDRILTCAHNVIDWGSRAEATSIEVIPGRNGAGGRPFGSFTVHRADWAYHPRYDGTRAFDLAVIRVTQPPPNHAWFEIEELNQSIEAPIVVCGYAAETVDEDRQHLDGDHIRSLGSGGETLQYNLQTEAGNSGSPVFYIRGREDEQQQMSLLEAVVIGVHVSAYDDRHNNACRLTADKIHWIRGAVSASHALSHAAGVHRPLARPFEVVDNVYRPTDPATALRAQREFTARRNRWRAGVDDTSFFPHSAICHFEIDFPSGPYWGTGFYIAPDRILTCAHNVKSFPRNEEARSIRVLPGRNGEHGTPFGSFTVPRSEMAVHERYDGGSDWDLAVFRVPTPPPHGQFFDVLEEQTQSVESPIVACGYSASNGADPYKQHLDGDTIRRVEAETFFYNLQTTPGASGSPVYYVDGYEDHERMMSVSRVVITGVHVARPDDGDPDRGLLNRACRLTHEKIRWIRSRFGATAGAHAYHTPAGALNAGAGATVGATIAGAVITALAGNTPGGEIYWSLDQMNGIKDPGDRPANRGTADFIPAEPVEITDVKGSTLGGLDEIFCNLRVDWQYNGRSLANVRVVKRDSNDAVGAQLRVEARITNDARIVRPRGGGPGFAVLRVLITYSFTFSWAGSETREVELEVYGNGQSFRRNR